MCWMALWVCVWRILRVGVWRMSRMCGGGKCVWRMCIYVTFPCTDYVVPWKYTHSRVLQFRNTAHYVLIEQCEVENGSRLGVHT